MKQLKWFGRAFVILGIALLALPFLGGTAGADDPTPNSFLKEAHVGSTNPGFETGDCPDEGWGWHFVLPDQTSEFVSLSVTFENAGVITTFNSFPTGKHAYVYTPGPDTLLGAEAVVSGDPPSDVFNLSHVCTGPEETTTTTVEETTTTVEETTTSEVLASTTDQEFTTTTEAATTTLPTDVQPAELARTGSNTATMVSGGLALILVGGVFMLRSRRFGTR